MDVLKHLVGYRKVNTEPSWYCCFDHCIYIKVAQGRILLRGYCIRSKTCDALAIELITILQARLLLRRVGYFHAYHVEFLSCSPSNKSGTIVKTDLPQGSFHCKDLFQKAELNSGPGFSNHKFISNLKLCQIKVCLPWVNWWMAGINNDSPCKKDT